MATSGRHPTARSSRQAGDCAARKAASGRRRDLIAVAAELFAERGYRATTVREIGDAAGVLSGSLYHHFDSKETILDELLSDYLEDLLATTRTAIETHGGDPRETLRGLVTGAFGTLAAHRAAIAVIHNERAYLAGLPRFAYVSRTETSVQRMWIEVLERGIRGGAFRSDLDPAITYRFLRESVCAAGRWPRPAGRLTPTQLAEHYLAMVLDGISATAEQMPSNGRARPRKRAAPSRRS